jgi:uncharacterized protein
MNAALDVILEHYPFAQAVYLFGSHLTPNQTPNSDVDIAVLLDHTETSSLALSDCKFALEKLLKKNVDLVNLRKASTVFKNEVIHNGRLIFVSSQSVVDEFEMLTMSFYQKLNEERSEILAEFEKTGRAYNV